MTGIEKGKTLAGGLNDLRISPDEKSLIWVNDAGELLTRPPDAIHVELWRQLRMARQAAESAGNQMAQMLADEDHGPVGSLQMVAFPVKPCEDSNHHGVHIRRTEQQRGEPIWYVCPGRGPLAYDKPPQVWEG